MEEKRKTIATTIYPSIWHNFKVKCVKNQENMNDVLEKFMTLYSEDKINLSENIQKDNLSPDQG